MTTTIAPSLKQPEVPSALPVVALAGPGTATPRRTPSLETTDHCRPQRVVVVHDIELVHAGLRALLARESWVASCYGASSTEAAWSIIRRHHPQLILISTAVGGESGLAFSRQLREKAPHIKTMLMSFEGRISASLAHSSGAAGFMSMHMPAAGIVAAVKHVAEGGHVFATDKDLEAEQLSRRELDVLHQLVSGASNPEAATLLNLSRHTVKQHTSAIYRKLGVRNRAQAASRARELGLVA